ncbi:MAG: heme o synthase [Chlamydiia bacterium]|nr:heme o synthase [Chlamydiia bacterium]
MEKLAQTPLRPTISYWIKAYFLLAKPGIIIGNALTAAGGFALAAKGSFNFLLFLATLEGLSLIIASACVLNNIIDRKQDCLMKRTQNRPLPSGIITPRSAFLYALLLGIAGALLLLIFTNLLTLAVALVGFGVYVGVYSVLKYITVHGTLIGSIAGAVPPVVGYTAVSGHFDGAALILFLMIVCWQMPHFFAIAIYRLEDYAAASIPVYPIKRGMGKTKVQILLYTIGFLLVTALLPLLGYVGKGFLLIMGLVSIGWLYLALQGWTAKNNQKWARKVFFYSLFIVMAFCLIVPFTTN